MHECAPPLLDSLRRLPSPTQKKFQCPCHDLEDPKDRSPKLCDLTPTVLPPVHSPSATAVSLLAQQCLSLSPLLSLFPLPRRFSPRPSHGNEFHCSPWVFGTDATIPERPSLATLGNQPPPPPLLLLYLSMWPLPPFTIYVWSSPPVWKSYEGRDFVCFAHCFVLTPSSGFV